MYKWNSFVDGVLYDIDDLIDDDVLVLLVGRSGSGKTTLEETLKCVGFKSVKSYTTRPPRYDGEDSHIFISKEEFDKLENKMGYTEFNGYEYCATKEQLDKANIYVIDPSGVEYLKEHYHGKKMFIVYLKANRSVCLERMIDRGDTRSQVLERLNNDDVEFSGFADKADIVIGANEEYEYVALNFVHNYTILHLNDHIEHLESEVERWKNLSQKLP